MSSTSLNQVLIYHDETKDVPGQNLKGHVLFFVPVRLSVSSQTPLFGEYLLEYSPLEELLQKIIDYRRLYSCNGKLHFTEISGKTWKKYDAAYRLVAEASVDALRHKDQKLFHHPLHCKVATMFYPKDTDLKLYGGGSRKERRLRHDETILRILLKGAAHFLYDDQHRLEIMKVISDGEPAHRSLSDQRIVWELSYDDLNGRSPLRDYATINPSAAITQLISDHKIYNEDTEEYRHANMLQIADLLLGSIIRACYHGIVVTKRLPQVGAECIKRDVIALPIKEMLDKRRRKSGFINSGHYKSFAVTKVDFAKDSVNFSEVETIDMQIAGADQSQMESMLSEDGA